MIGYDAAHLLGSSHLRRHGREFRGALDRAEHSSISRSPSPARRSELGVQLDVALPDGSRARSRAPALEAAQHHQRRRPRPLARALRDRAARRRPAGAQRTLARHGRLPGLRAAPRARAYGDPLPAGVVLVAATAHYSWEKIVRALGIGSNQLVLRPGGLALPHGPRRALGAACSASAGAEARRSWPASASAAPPKRARSTGSTPCSRCARAPSASCGVTFHVHSDACYGGYAASGHLARRRRRAAPPPRSARALGLDWPERRLGARDRGARPGRFGHDRPAQARLRPLSGRRLPAARPPRAGLGQHRPAVPRAGAATTSRRSERFLGRYIFEGSKPGAARGGVWLSHKVLPLDERGLRPPHRAHGARRAPAARGAGAAPRWGSSAPSCSRSRTSTSSAA